MSTASRRIDGVDAVRGLAIVLMVFSHGLNWFHIDGSHAVISIGRLSLGDAAAPLFFVIAGVALSLSFAARRRRGMSAGVLADQYRRRFRQLFVLGIPISFAWGVLQAQAITLGTIVFLLLYVFERDTAASESVNVFAGSRGIVGRWWPFALALGALVIHAFIASANIGSSLLEMLFQGAFPLFAIMAFVSFGFGVGRWLQASNWRRRFYVVGALFIAAGWIAAGGAGAKALVRVHMPLPYIFGGIGAALWLLAFMDAPAVRPSRPLRLFADIGRHGLFLYLAHYGLILIQVLAFGWWHTLDTPGAVAASLLLVGMTAFIGLHYRIDARVIYGRMDAVARWWSGAEPIRTGDRGTDRGALGGQPLRPDARDIIALRGPGR